MPGLTVAYLLAAAGVMAWLGVRAAWRADRTPETTLRDIAVLLMAGLFFLSPNYAWYFLAVVPFIALGGGAPAWAMTLAAPLLYRPLFLPDNDVAWKTLAIAAVRHRRGLGAEAARARIRAQDKEHRNGRADDRARGRPRPSMRAATSKPARDRSAASPTSRRCASTWRSPTAATCCAPPVRAPMPSWSRRPTCRGSCSPASSTRCPNLSRAVLHGVGEPMLVKNLPQMVRYLKDRGAYVLFNTNGTVLNEKNGRALIAAGLDELRVSLDASTPESYIKVRGKDYFRRILRNVKAFRAMQEREGHAKPRVSAWLTGLKETIDELPAFVRVAAEIGVKEVYLQRLVFFDRDTVGLARPDQALFERMNGDEAQALDEAEALAKSLGLTFSASGAASEPGLEPCQEARRQSLVAVPAAVDGHVLHRQRARAALLHRAVLAARLRELHAGRRHPGDPARDLERAALPVLPRRPAVGSTAAGVRQLRHALEPVIQCSSQASAPSCPSSSPASTRKGRSPTSCARCWRRASTR